MLIGKVPKGNKSVMIENNNITKTPDNTIQLNNILISPVFKIDLQICGTAKPINAIGPVKAVADAVKIADENNINKRIFFILIPTDCAYFSPNNKAEIPLNVNNDKINPIPTNNANTKIWSQDNPLNDPNPHIKKVLIFSEVEKYCNKPIIATVIPDSINPKITNEADDVTLFANNKIKNKANKEPINEAKINIQGLFNQTSSPINANKKTTIATPKLDMDVIPKTEGSAKGFLNNSCNKNPATGKDKPTNTVVILLGNL